MMKKFIPYLYVIILLSCNQIPTTNTETKTDSEQSHTASLNLKKYPEALQKVFDKHGSLERWNKMNGLYFEIQKAGGNEKTSVDLKNRRERIEATDFKTGFDGENFWLEADTSYQGNPVFYHNLMFYFYAMPFVVADPGIIYSDAESIVYEEKTYPGIRISYNDGVGVSPKDEYFLYYNPQTFEMAWLGYTVTYYSKEKSDKRGWIRYDDWKDFNGLILPNSATWFATTDDGKLKGPKKTRNFENIRIQEKTFDDKIFERTEGAILVNSK